MAYAQRKLKPDCTANARTELFNKGYDLPVQYQVLLAEEDGWIIAEVPALPGCVSQGRTREEALERIKDALHGCIESRKAHGLFVPSFE